LIGINNLFTVLFKNWINWFSTHIKHPYCLFKHILTYFLHNYNVCFKRVGRKKAGRLLDGRTWDEFPRQEVAG
jgi:protein gp37